jgi:hypothetical protein
VLRGLEEIHRRQLPLQVVFVERLDNGGHETKRGEVDGWATVHACALVLVLLRTRARSLLLLPVAWHHAGHGGGALLAVAPRAIAWVRVAILLVSALSTLPHQLRWCCAGAAPVLRRWCCAGAVPVLRWCCAGAAGAGAILIN